MRNFIFIMSLMFLFAGCAQDSAVYKTAADTAMKAPTHEEAVKQYIAVVKKSYNTSDYHEGLADIHYAFGFWGEAVNDYTRALRIHQKSRMNLKRGRAYMHLGFYPDAISDFDTVLYYEGRKMPIIYTELAKAYVEQGDYNEAEKFIKKATEKGGDSVELTAAMAKMYYMLGKYDEASRTVQKTLLKDNKYADVYLTRAKIYYKNKDANQTIKDLKTVLELEKDNKEAKRFLAWVYSTNPFSSYRNGEKAVELAKELYEGSNGEKYVEVMAAAYAENGNIEQAVHILKESVKNTADLVKKEDIKSSIKRYEAGELIRLW